MKYGDPTYGEDPFACYYGSRNHQQRCGAQCPDCKKNWEARITNYEVEVFQIYKDIGNQIRKHRNQRGLSQQELGEKVGTQKQYIYDLEKGNITCSLTKLSEIANALDCNLEVTLNRKR